MAHRIPADYKHTRSTAFFDRNSVPQALLTHHNTKKDVYGRLSVMRGAVKYIGLKMNTTRRRKLNLLLMKGSLV